MRFILFFSIVFSLFSCNKDVIDVTSRKEVKSKKKEQLKDKTFIINIKKEKLHSKAKQSVEDWNEYLAVADYIPKFYNTTTKEALLNSIQFYKLTSYLKDSLKQEKFKISSLKIRLNVLNNEALRLFDMDSIPSITNNEVISQTKNIVNAFNALNVKINNMVKREFIIKDLSEFNHLFNNEKKDSLNIKPIKLTPTQRKRKIEKRKRILKKKRIKPLSIIK